jgi:hypothetical protein
MKEILNWKINKFNPQSLKNAPLIQALRLAEKAHIMISKTWSKSCPPICKVTLTNLMKTQYIKTIDSHIKISLDMKARTQQSITVDLRQLLTKAYLRKTALNQIFTHNNFNLYKKSVS